MSSQARCLAPLKSSRCQPPVLPVQQNFYRTTELFELLLFDYRGSGIATMLVTCAYPSSAP